MELLMWLFVFCGLLQAGLAVPMIRRWVPPNVIYGFRVRATLENPELWYDVNAHFGRGMLVSAVVIVLAALFLARFNLSVDQYALTCLLIFMVPLTLALMLSLRYLKARGKQLADPEAASRN